MVMNLLNNTRGNAVLVLINGCVVAGLILSALGATGCGVAWTPQRKIAGFTSFVKEVNRGDLPPREYVTAERYDIEAATREVSNGSN